MVTNLFNIMIWVKKIIILSYLKKKPKKIISIIILNISSLMKIYISMTVIC
jgi:hypothetical protein